MSWGGLNNALASWRDGVNRLFPGRSTRSDGGRADSNHQSTSQHQPDADGTVDAFDEDANYRASRFPAGSPEEVQIRSALDADFMRDPRAYLIIGNRTIRNDLIGNWRVRAYGGSSPHIEHTHRQVHQSREDDGAPWSFPNTLALLARWAEENDVALKDQDIALTDDTCDALGKPRGTVMDAALLLQYGVLHAARASKGVAGNAARLTTIEALLRQEEPPPPPA